jgi:hypothetical protein
VVSFTPRPLYPQGESTRYPLDRRLGELQSRSGLGGEEKNFQPLRESNPRTPIVQPIAQRYTECAITALSQNPEDLELINLSLRNVMPVLTLNIWKTSLKFKSFSSKRDFPGVQQPQFVSICTRVISIFRPVLTEQIIKKLL